MAKTSDGALLPGTLTRDPYPVGTVVAIRTDEAVFPHLGIIKSVDSKAQPQALYDILWMYRRMDCTGGTKPPPKQLLRSPCTYERLSGERVVEPGDLKEIFFSGHAGNIPHGTIIHAVQVLFLPSSGSGLDASTLEHLQLQPGMICRYLVDITGWTYHPLKPSLLEFQADGALLSGLLQASDKRLKKIVSDTHKEKERGG